MSRCGAECCCCCCWPTEGRGQQCTPAERSAVDWLIQRGSRLAGEMEREIVQSLHHRGLVYLDVPIASDDLISGARAARVWHSQRCAVPPLEGFVMNRVTGDHFESLLYKVFVSLDERTTIQQLAALLQLSLDAVKYAVSIYCRLGFAKKKNAPSLKPGAVDAGAVTWHLSWLAPAPLKAPASAASAAPSPPASAAPSAPLASSSSSLRNDDLFQEDPLRDSESHEATVPDDEPRPVVVRADFKGADRRVLLLRGVTVRGRGGGLAEALRAVV